MKGLLAGQRNPRWLQYINSHHAQPLSSVAKVMAKDSRTTDSVRSILAGLRKKRTKLWLNGPKSSFQMKVNLISFENQDPRV